MFIHFQCMSCYNYHFHTLISSSDWFALNSCLFFSLATFSNSIGKSILCAPLTSLVAALMQNLFWDSILVKYTQLVELGVS
jgi:hypothetical protein